MKASYRLLCIIAFGLATAAWAEHGETEGKGGEVPTGPATTEFSVSYTRAFFKASTPRVDLDSKDPSGAKGIADLKESNLCFRNLVKDVEKTVVNHPTARAKADEERRGPGFVALSYRLKIHQASAPLFWRQCGFSSIALEVTLTTTEGTATLDVELRAASPPHILARALSLLSAARTRIDRGRRSPAFRSLPR